MQPQAAVRLLRGMVGWDGEVMTPNRQNSIDFRQLSPSSTLLEPLNSPLSLLAHVRDKPKQRAGAANPED